MPGADSGKAACAFPGAGWCSAVRARDALYGLPYDPCWRCAVRRTKTRRMSGSSSGQFAGYCWSAISSLTESGATPTLIAAGASRFLAFGSGWRLIWRCIPIGKRARRRFDGSSGIRTSMRSTPALKPVKLGLAFLPMQQVIRDETR